MTIDIIEVSSKRKIKKFAKFPCELYKNDKFWVPPIILDEIKTLSKDTNPAFEFCDVKLWLAYKGNKIVGRIGALINKLSNNKNNEKAGRIMRAEFIDDKEVSKSLFEIAENWLKKQEMNKVYGPLGFSNLDLQGLLIEGFEHLPSVASVYHKPYYKSHFEKLGYKKEIDWLEFRLTLEEKIPEKALKLNEVIKKRYGLKVISFNDSKELMNQGNRIFDLLNTAFDELFSVVKFDNKMKKYYMQKYFKILNPKFVKIVENKEGDVVGFIISIPSLSKAMRKAKGKIYPFGVFHVFNAMKKNDTADLLLTGIDPKMQGQGVSAILITELQKAYLDFGIKYVETTGIFETNQKAIQHWKNYNHIQHKRRRCFVKDL